MPDKGQQKAGDWVSPEKFAVVLETASLSDEALAEYCRRGKTASPQEQAA